MDSFDWLEQLHREAWAARIRQMRRELREEKEQVQTRPFHQTEQSFSQQRQRPTQTPYSTTQ